MTSYVITKITPPIGSVQTLVHPAVPAIPAHPAYSYTIPVSETVYLYSKYIQVYDPINGTYTVGVPPLVPYTFTYDIIVNVPAQPYIPAVPAIYSFSTVVSANLGWNGGGKSISLRTEGFEYGFTFGPGTVNTYVGLNTGVDSSTNPLDIPIAVNSTRGITTLRYPGGTIVIGVYDQFLFARDKNNDITLQYFNGTSWAYVESSPGVPWSYNFTAPIFLDASIYAGANYVELWKDVGYLYAASPILVSATLSDSNLKSALTIKAAASVVSGIGQNATVKYLRTTIPAVASIAATPHGDLTLQSTITAVASVSGTLIQGGDLILPALVSLGSDRNIGSSRGSLPALTTLIIPSIPVPDVVVSITELPLMISSAHGYSGYIGSASTTLPSLQALAANKIYGESTISLPAMSAFSGQIGAADEAYAVDGYVFATTPAVQFLGSVDGSDVINIQTSMDTVKELHEAIYSNINPNIAPVVILTADVNAITSISVVVTEQTADANDWGSWVVNYETDAHWRYDNFQFNSFTTFNGTTYGCKEDGIYALTGNTDNGSIIEAKVTTAVTDFDNSQKKHMLKTYLGVKSDGDLLLKVLAEGGNVYYYGVDKTRTSVGGTRVNVGRGLTSRYWQFELLNVDGADFELDAIEFFPVITSRREM